MKLEVPNVVAAATNADLATDVAAFANAAGGVLLVGAHEHPKNSGILRGYVPLTQADANNLGATLKGALELCSPKPVAEAKSFQLSDGSGWVVAINCDPYGAPPIGVAHPGHSGGEKWWAFPVRRGRDTHNLRPEELATIMEPRLRRISLLLAQIPVQAPQSHPQAKFHSGGAILTLNILSVDPDRSSLRLGNTEVPKELTIPLDAVRMIWREATAEVFHVAITGRLAEASNKALYYYP